jgi:hypothetical protein
MSQPRVVAELSARGLSNLHSDESDFAFVFDKDEVRCSRFQAQFLSPAVCAVLRTDPSIDRIEVNIETGDKSAVQSFLSQLLSTGRIAIPVSDLSVLLDFSTFLGNQELIDLLVNRYLSDVNESNVVERLKIYGREEDLSFLASHLSAVCESGTIGTLSLDTISRVLNHRNLQVSSEDSLFRFIESLCMNDERSRELIEYVEVQYLSDSCIGDYLSFVDGDRLNRSTWLSICRRLKLSVSPSNMNPRLRCEAVHYEGDASQMFRGIFHKMAKACHGNPHFSGKVKVSANDEHANCRFQVHELIVASDKTGHFWGTKRNILDHYVKFEFPLYYIRPSGYSLKAHNGSWTLTGHYIRTWRFEGSNDDSVWTALDTQNDTDAIAANDKEAYFAVSATEAYRFLRIIAGGPDSSGHNQWSLQQIEIFGEIHGSANA